MLMLQSLVLYGLAGLAVAAAFLLRGEATPARQGVLAAASLAFWPLLLPLLLTFDKAARRPTSGADAISASRLKAALAGLEGLTHELAEPELARIRVLSRSMTALEARVHEMDALLGSPEFDLAAAERALDDLVRRGIAEADGRVASVRARLRNIAHLRALRERAAGDLERVCLQLEGIPAQLRLLRFAGSDVSDQTAVAAIRDVADAMQTLTEELLTDARAEGAAAGPA